MTATDSRLIQDARTVGWAHALRLIADGMREDAATCEAEGWPETAAALFDQADDTDLRAEAVRKALHKAEDKDKLDGCD